MIFLPFFAEFGAGCQNVVKTNSALNIKFEEKSSRNTPNKGQKKSLILKAADIKLHLENLSIVLRCSSATPIRAQGSLGYCCYFCDSEYADPADLKKHTTENHLHNDKPFKSLRNSHYCMKMNITGLRCKLCELLFDQLEPLMDHLKNSHEEPIHTHLKNHLIPFKFDSEQLKCAVCNLEFYNFHTLLDHMRKHYRNYICDVCDEGYLNYNSLRTHRSAHNKGEYPCKECDKIFSSSTKLNGHKRAVHLGIKKNKCGYCGEKFAERSGKLDHLEKVHGMKKPEIKCRICNRTYSSLKTLDGHMRGIHMMEKAEECPICSTKFFKKDTLKHHMTIHTGHRAFECSVCSKSFLRRTTLREHMRIHINDRRFKCEHCSMAFIQKCTWKGHMRSKHGKDI